MKKQILIFVLFILLPIAYVTSILWRVHVAEMSLFGASEILPFIDRSKFIDPPVKDSYGQRTYIFFREREPIVVWRQEVNGFQHIYGTALAAYELGGQPAALLFCANEFVEAGVDFLTDPRGIEPSDLLDRHKDLFHNQTGYRIASETRRRHLNGREAEDFIQQQVLTHMEQGNGYIPHYSDPKVARLKTETALGCPGLPPVVSLRKLLRLDK